MPQMHDSSPPERSSPCIHVAGRSVAAAELSQIAQGYSISHRVGILGSTSQTSSGVLVPTRGYGARTLRETCALRCGLPTIGGPPDRLESSMPWERILGRHIPPPEMLDTRASSSKIHHAFDLHSVAPCVASCVARREGVWHDGGLLRPPFV